MPGSYNSPAGDLETTFVTNYSTIDQFAATGTLWTWGYGGGGQLGDNTVNNKSSPVQTVASGTNWAFVGGGQTHNLAIKTDGTLWLWGKNNNGQLGDNTITDRSSPVQTVTFGTNWIYVSAGDTNTVAIKTDGTLWGWGRNSEGQLGDNTTLNRSSPVQTVAFGRNWVRVSTFRHTMSVKTDGTLWGWGINSFGQIGDNTGVSKSSPVQVVGAATNWQFVAAGRYQTAAIKTDGTLWTWGLNNQGELGNGTSGGITSSPAQTVAGGTNWKQVAAALSTQTQSSFAAIKTDGTLWTWGFNSNGQLGDGTTVNKSSPVQTVTYGTNWKQVSGMGWSVAATKTDGTLWTWGWNFAGQLGDGTVTSKSSPVQIVTRGTNWKLTGSGAYTGAAIYFNNATGNFPSAGT